MRLYDDFSAPHGWPGTQWTKFSPGPYELWDKNTIVECPGAPDAALTIRIPRYTLSHPPHHIKALTLSSAALAPPADGPLVVRLDMAAQIFGTHDNPFEVDPGDPRLSAAAIVLIETETGMVTDFFVSNDHIFALYERLPYAQAKLGPYPAFTKLFSTDIQTAPGQWHRYEIRHFPRTYSAEWWVDGICVHRQERLGAPPGEDGPLVRIKQLRFGAGLFTLLDDVRNDRRSDGDSPPVTGLITARQGELFGQGGEVSLKEVVVAGDILR